MESKKTKIILMRHAESKANADGIYQGQKFDTGLSDSGRLQATAVAGYLKSFGFTKIFTSIYPRAIETAAYVKNFYPEVPCFELKELNERFIGAVEGTPKDEFAKKYAHILADWHNEIDTRPEGGESFEDVHKRVAPLIEKHVLENAGKNLLYVIHGNVNRILIGHALGIPYGKQMRIRQDYCALNSMVYDHARDRWEVEYINFVNYVL